MIRNRQNSAWDPFFFFFTRLRLFFSPSICSSHDLLSSDIMETTAIFIGWWRSSSCPCYATCPICSSQQPLGEKKKTSTTQKWLRGERWNVICACHATVLGVFHKANVMPLRLLSFMHYWTLLSFLHQQHEVCLFFDIVGHSAFVQDIFWVIYCV